MASPGQLCWCKGFFPVLYEIWSGIERIFSYTCNELAEIVFEFLSLVPCSGVSLFIADCKNILYSSDIKNIKYLNPFNIFKPIHYVFKRNMFVFVL